MRINEKLKHDGWIEMADGFLTKYNNKYRLEFLENCILDNKLNYLDIFEKSQSIRVKNITYEEIKQLENILLK